MKPSDVGATGMSAQAPIETPALEPSERDLQDARCLALILEATRQWESATDTTTSMKPLREWIWFTWQKPRLPRPLVRGKYPVSWLWSLAARDAYFGDPRGCALVVDHVEPIARVIRDLIDGVAWDGVSLATALHARLECRVITAQENSSLTGVGVASRSAAKPGMSRYAAAAIPDDDFLPLDEDRRYLS
jgi:hypothetical protein